MPNQSVPMPKLSLRMPNNNVECENENFLATNSCYQILKNKSSAKDPTSQIQSKDRSEMKLLLNQNYKSIVDDEEEDDDDDNLYHDAISESEDLLSLDDARKSTTNYYDNPATMPSNVNKDNFTGKEEAVEVMEDQTTVDDNDDSGNTENNDEDDNVKMESRDRFDEEQQMGDHSKRDRYTNQSTRNTANSKVSLVANDFD